MKKYIVVMLFVASLFSLNEGFAQTAKKHHKKAVAGCPVPPKHHKRTLAKRHPAKQPTMHYQTFTVNDRTNIAIVEIKKGNILVNDSLVGKVTNPKYEDDNIIINYIAPPAPPVVDVSKENGYSANLTSSGKPMLGVYTEDYCGGGAMIEDILPCGPADKAGLYPGDVIVKINDQEVNSTEEMIAAIAKYNAGDNISVTYRYFGRTETTDAALADRDNAESCNCPEPETSYNCNGCDSPRRWRR